MNAMEKNSGRKRSHVFIFTLSVTFCFSYAIGFRKCTGIFFIYFQDAFNTSASQTSLIFSLTTSTMFLGGPFYGAFVKKMGPKFTYLTAAALVFIAHIGVYFSNSLLMVILFYSIINGIGSGLSHISSFTVVNQVFGKKRSLVNNLLQLFSNLTAMASASGFQAMMKTYSWRDVMLIMAAITLNGLPFGWLAGKYYYILMDDKTSSESSFPGEKEIELKDSTSIITVKKTSEKTVNSSGFALLLKSTSRMFDASLLKDSTFWIFCISTAGTMGYRHIFSQYFIRYAQDVGIEKQAAANLYTIFLAHSLVFSMLMGFLTSVSPDKMIWNIKFPRTATVVITSTWSVTLIQLIPVVWETYTGFLVYVILCGIADGCIGTLPLSLIPTYFGEERIPGALGFRSFTTGLYNLCIPPFIGYLIDLFGTYKPSLIACSILTFIGAATLLFVDVKSVRRHKKLESFRNGDIVTEI